MEQPTFESVKEKYETGEDKVSFLDDCLRIDTPFETTQDSGKTRNRVERDGNDNKTFGTNNGKLAFVTEGGLMYATTATSEKITELEAMGFKNTGLGVPLSNNEIPARQEDLDKWLKITGGKMNRM